MDDGETETKRDRLLNRKDAAAYLTDLGLEMAAQTLARKFHEGCGPLCTHVGDRAMYWRRHLDDYFNEHLSAPRRSSSEPRVAAYAAEQDNRAPSPLPASMSKPRGPQSKLRRQRQLAPASMPLPF